MRIVDDDVDWKQFMQSEEKDKPDEEEEEAPVVGTDSRTISLETTLLTGSRFVKFVPFTPQVAEVIDERPDEVKRLEEFTNSNKWKTVGAVPSTQQCHDSDSDVSPPRQKARRSDSDLSPPRRRPQQGGRQGSDSDLSPPRRRPQQGGRRGSDSDLSPPRRNARPSSDMSPPRRGNGVQGANQMLSGGAAGLVSVEVLRKEHEENRKRERQNKPLEDASRNAQTVFRDKSGKKRDIELERIEKQKAAGEKAEKDEKYAQWGKGLVQGDMQQRNVEDAVLEAQKPLARHIDDEDLDKLLREQERDGDPMAGLLRKKKEKEGQKKGVKERPKYKGPPPPPNRFNIMPGYRWDGVNRSNGFEKQRYSRMADKKAVQEVAYKWSVEDM
ncbi:BUD13-like [Acipenser ruthenus]|uniref:BUD13 homolog n=1 Tax=Acipenser ruthenus TaxID=7906 RepID=A0A444V167_ACIRT|nr:BUD13-like [Acipenser ruthenus]